MTKLQTVYDGAMFRSSNAKTSRKGENSSQRQLFDEFMVLRCGTFDFRSQNEKKQHTNSKDK